MRRLALVWLSTLAACSASGVASSGSTGGGGSSVATSSNSTGGGSAASHGTTGSASTTRRSSTSGGASSSGGGSSANGGSSSGGGSSGGSTGTPGSFSFPSTSVFYQDISGATADPNSAAVMSAIGAWGSGNFQIDFSMNILYGDPSKALQPFTQASGYYTPDCDATPFPQLPPGGSIEGSEGTATPYGCDTAHNDCHLFIYQGHWLFEMYNATTDSGLYNGNLTALCEVAWDLTHDYWTYGANPYSRGDWCSSTDGAGMPVAPLLVTGAELASGVVSHALRFILPNALIQVGDYVHPGTHGTSATSGSPPLPIYGSRFRLRSDYPVNTLPNPAAQAVAVALQKYGMFLDDGGNIPLTFDQSAQAYIGSHDLFGIQPSDFELIDSPDPTVQLGGSCTRTPLTTTN